MALIIFLVFALIILFVLISFLLADKMGKLINKIIEFFKGEEKWVKD